MKKYKSQLFLLFILLIILFSSCIMDEYKLDDLSIEDDWGMDIILPFFTDSLTINNFIKDSDYQEFKNDSSVVLQFEDSRKFINKEVLCLSRFENKGYDLTLIDGQNHLDSVRFLMIADNKFDSDIDLIFTFEDTIGYFRHRFKFEIPKNIENYKSKIDVSTENMHFIQNFTTIDITGLFENCDESFSNKLIEKDDYLKFTLVLSGKVEKNHNE